MPSLPRPPEAEILSFNLILFAACAHSPRAFEAPPTAPPRVALLDGYHIEAVATGLVSPRGVTFDNADGVYVLVAAGPDGTGSRILRLGPSGATEVLATDATWTGATWHQSGFLVAEAGRPLAHVGLDGARTPRVDAGTVCDALTTSTAVVGPDGWVYFGRDAPSGPGGACARALYRAREAGEAEVVAAGFAGPFEVAFGMDGRPYVADEAQLWAVPPGDWYGRPEEGRRPLDAAARRPEAAVRLATRPRGVDVSRDPAFGYVDAAFVATADDAGPLILRVDPEAGTVLSFAANQGILGGAHPPGRALGQPVALRFDPPGRSLYVVDAGAGAADGSAIPGTGVVWRIWREPAGARASAR